jgi:hypothetical protein
MSSMSGIGLTGRPVMQYVRELESKVLTLRADRRRWRWLSFGVGFVAGIAATLAAIVGTAR